LEGEFDYQHTYLSESDREWHGYRYKYIKDVSRNIDAVMTDGFSDSHAKNHIFA